MAFSDDKSHLTLSVRTVSRAIPFLNADGPLDEFSMEILLGEYLSSGTSCVI